MTLTKKQIAEIEARHEALGKAYDNNTWPGDDIESMFEAAHDDCASLLDHIQPVQTGGAAHAARSLTKAERTVMRDVLDFVDGDSSGKWEHREVILLAKALDRLTAPAPQPRVTEEDIEHAILYNPSGSSAKSDAKAILALLRGKGVRV